MNTNRGVIFDEAELSYSILIRQFTTKLVMSRGWLIVRDAESFLWKLVLNILSSVAGNVCVGAFVRKMAFVTRHVKRYTFVEKHKSELLIPDKRAHSKL